MPIAPGQSVCAITNENCLNMTTEVMCCSEMHFMWVSKSTSTGFVPSCKSQGLCSALLFSITLDNCTPPPSLIISVSNKINNNSLHFVFWSCWWLKDTPLPLTTCGEIAVGHHNLCRKSMFISWERKASKTNFTKHPGNSKVLQKCIRWFLHTCKILLLY